MLVLFSSQDHAYTLSCLGGELPGPRMAFIGRTFFQVHAKSKAHCQEEIQGGEEASGNEAEFSLA